MAKYISIGTWAYTIGPYEKKPVAFEDVVAKLKELGFDGLELGAFPPHPNPDSHPAKADRERVRKLVEDAGLRFSGLAANLWDESNHFLTTDSNDNVLREFGRNVDFAKDLGIDTIRVDTLEPPTILEGQVEYEVALDRAVQTFAAMADLAAVEGKRVCWEFEPGFAFNKPSQIMDVVRGVNKKNFGALYDTCHANMVAKIGSRQPGEKETLRGNAVELARMLKGHITHLHLIDSDDTCHKTPEGADETSAHPPFGDGHLDFDELIPVLLDAGVPNDWWVIDLCFWDNAWEATEQCREFLDAKRKQFDVAP